MSKAAKHAKLIKSKGFDAHAVEFGSDGPVVQWIASPSRVLGRTNLEKSLRVNITQLRRRASGARYRSSVFQARLPEDYVIKDLQGQWGVKACKNIPAFTVAGLKQFNARPVARGEDENTNSRFLTGVDVYHRIEPLPKGSKELARRVLSGLPRGGKCYITSVSLDSKDAPGIMHYVNDYRDTGEDVNCALLPVLYCALIPAEKPEDVMIEIAVVTLRDIARGEWLLVDYGKPYWSAIKFNDNNKNKDDSDEDEDNKKGTGSGDAKKQAEAQPQSPPDGDGDADEEPQVASSPLPPPPPPLAVSSQVAGPPPSPPAVGSQVDSSPPALSLEEEEHSLAQSLLNKVRKVAADRKACQQKLEETTKQNEKLALKLAALADENRQLKQKLDRYSKSETDVHTLKRKLGSVSKESLARINKARTELSSQLDSLLST